MIYLAEYHIGSEDIWLKIGRAEDVDKRIKQFNMPVDPSALIEIKPSDDSSDSEIENLLLNITKIISQKKGNGREWRVVKTSKAEELMIVPLAQGVDVLSTEGKIQYAKTKINKEGSFLPSLIKSNDKQVNLFGEETEQNPLKRIVRNKTYSIRIQYIKELECLAYWTRNRTGELVDMALCNLLEEVKRSKDDFLQGSSHALLPDGNIRELPEYEKQKRAERSKRLGRPKKNNP